jgi:hypothetical protein
MNVFPIYFKNVLDEFPQSEFLAISLPSKRFLWKNENLVEYIREFINSGGRMKRVFMLDDMDKLIDEEREVINKQREIGVDVYLIRKDRIELKDQKYLFVESKGLIGWEPLLGRGQEIILIRATSNPNKTSEYINLFNRFVRVSQKLDREL